MKKNINNRVNSPKWAVCSLAAAVAAGLFGPTSAMASDSERSAPESVDEIVVTGSYTSRDANSATGLAMTLRETPQSITVITQARIEDQNLDEISEVLSQTVGLTYDGTTLGSDGTYFYARGFPVTNFQVSGVPRPSGIYGFQETTSDMTSYERIEIVRGATGLMNGVGNPSASINMIRKRASEEFAATTSVETGSWGHARYALDIGGPLVESGRVRGRIAGSYQEDDTHIDRINIEKQSLYGVIEADVTENIVVSLGAEYQDFVNSGASRGGLPLFFTDGTRTDFSRSANTGTPWSNLENTSENLFASLEYRFSDNWLLRLNAEHATPTYDDVMGYMLGELDPTTGAGGTLYSARWAADLEQDFLGAYVQGTFDWFGRDHDLVMGLSSASSKDEGPDYCGWWCGGEYRQPVANGFDLIETGGNIPMPSMAATGATYGGEIEQSSAYAALRLRPVDRLAVILGARVTDWKETGYYADATGVKSYDPVNEEKDVVTPYAGLVFDINDTISAYASATEIFEPQNFHDITGSKLDPLEGSNYEVGVKAEFLDGRLSASAGVYRIEQDNFAIWVPDVFTPEGDSVYRTEDGTLSEGFELEIAGEILPGWQMVGGFSRAESEDSTGGRLNSNIPRDNFKLFSSYKFQGDLNKLTLGGNILAERNATAEAEWLSASYEQSTLVAVDIFGKYELNRNFVLQININNLFDREYYAGFNTTVSYAQPRNITASVRWIF